MNQISGIQGPDAAKALGRLLVRYQKTLAVAESCTGGLISSMITDVAGSSDYFLFSAVTYSNESKIRFLGVREKTLADHGAVHEATAIEMAEGVRQRAGADYGLSTTGIAGPGGGSAAKPVGMVCIGFSGPEKTISRTFQFDSGDRIMNKRIFAATALDFLLQELSSG